MNRRPLPIRLYAATLVCTLILWVCAGGSAQASGQGDTRILEDGAYFPALMEMIDRAKSEIVMAFFLFKTNGHETNRPDRIAAALGRAAGRGIRVRVILEKRKDDRGSLADASNEETARRLKKRGIDVGFDSPRTTTHTKVIVIDGRYLFLGSHNLTNSALKYNHELSVCIDSPSLAGEVLRYINTLDR